MQSHYKHLGGTMNGKETGVQFRPGNEIGVGPTNAWILDGDTFLGKER